MGTFSSKKTKRIYIRFDFYSEISKLLKYVIFPKFVKINISNKKQTNKQNKQTNKNKNKQTNKNKTKQKTNKKKKEKKRKKKKKKKNITQNVSDQF